MYSHQNVPNTISRLLTPPPIIQRDPKRQSQLLMESKRRSLAIKDTDLLEQMLRGDLEGFDQYHPSDDEEEEEESEDDHITATTTATTITTASNKIEQITPTTLSSRSASPSTILIEQEEFIVDEENDKKGTNSSCLTCVGFPCTFPCKHSLNLIKHSKKDDPFALFTGVTIVLGIASQLGVTDDWTVPITLATLVSGFLWNGNSSKNKKKAT